MTLCPVFDCFFGAIRDGEDGYAAVQVYRDGNPHVIAGGFETDDEAEECAVRERCRQLEALCLRLRAERDDWKDRCESVDRDFTATLKAIDRENQELRF